MNCILYSTYFPSISHFVAITQSDAIIFEVEDNFQKQTNRNRTYIYSPNGIQLLNVPVKSSNSRQMTKDVRIETAFNWQKQHFGSLESAYRTSPFFEYYEDTIMPVFTKKYNFLLDLNFETIEIVSKCLKINLPINKTSEYFHEVPNYKDFRVLANGKKDPNQFESYTQVFHNKHGFLNNLSILDVLFNEGRLALDYLKSQKLLIPD
jgi:hypothetical protein